LPFDKFHEECAVVGLIDHPESSKYCYLALFAQQHRGQEGSGIASTDGTAVFAHREMGLVADIFGSETLEKLPGDAAIGHCRYATFGSKDWLNLQPFVANFRGDFIALAHNGNLINAGELRLELEQQGAIFSSTSDSEVILHLIAREDAGKDFIERLAAALRRVKGAYSLAVMNRNRLYAVRDPAGVRPLAVAAMPERGHMVASETCAFDLVGATFVRDVLPGEIVEISPGGKMRSQQFSPAKEAAFCVFEYIYFARPDSVIDGRNVYIARKRLGAQLAVEHPADVDIVIPVPDSGVPAAVGFAQQLGNPMELGLIRNHYVGRTFIEPSQSIRDFGVKVKLNPNREVLEGKRVAVVDDSIVRGTTCRKLIHMIRSAGAKEVHFRVSSPPTIGPCYYGIDTPTESELIAANNDIPAITKYIGADTLGYLSIEGVYTAIKAERKNFCDACFSNNYKLGKTDPNCAVSAGCLSGGRKPGEAKLRK
jgi:amidophosphoribosyltransferase